MASITRLLALACTFILAYATIVSAASTPGKKATCSSALVQKYQTISHRPVVFCNWWLDSARTESPSKTLSAAQLTQVCQCVVPGHKKRDSVSADLVELESAATLSARDTSVSRRDTCPDNKITLFKQIWTEPQAFCTFWQLNSRASSPWPQDLPLATMNKVCSCVVPKTPSKASCYPQKVKAYEAISTKPLTFCQWWLSTKRTSSPAIDLTANDITLACGCVVQSQPKKRDLEKTLQAEESNVGSARIHVRAIYARQSSNQCSAVDITSLEDRWRNPRRFCTFWQERSRTSSPWPALSVGQLNTACRCLLAPATTTARPSTSSRRSSTTSSRSSTTPSRSSSSSVSRPASTSPGNPTSASVKSGSSAQPTSNSPPVRTQTTIPAGQGASAQTTTHTQATGSQTTNNAGTTTPAAAPAASGTTTAGAQTTTSPAGTTSNPGATTPTPTSTMTGAGTTTSSGATTSHT